MNTPGRRHYLIYQNNLQLTVKITGPGNIDH